MQIRRAAWPMVVSVVIVGILALGVFPTRTYLAQRRGLQAAEARVKILSAHNEEMAAQVRKLNTDAEIERLAREQYSLVRPGEEAYAILPPPKAAVAPAPGPASAPPAEPPKKKKKGHGLFGWF